MLGYKYYHEYLISFKNAATFLYYYPPGQALDRNGGGFIIPVPGGG